VTFKEDMVLCLNTSTETTIFITLPPFLGQVSRNLELIIMQLPKKKLNFQGHLASPDEACNPTCDPSISKEAIQ
jgi:hypothetical protein